MPNGGFLQGSDRQCNTIRGRRSPSCVKTLDTEKVAMSLAPHLAPGAVVVSLQNGVDNVNRIRAVGPFEAIPAVVYVAAAMTGPGHVKHSGRGDLIVGNPSGGRGGEPERLAAIFARGGVPCAVSDNIQAELWTKMSMNCAYNAVSALGRAKYGRVTQHPQARELLRLAVEETAAVARAAGISLPREKLVEAAFRLGEVMSEATLSEATSSTAQDVHRGKPTEIDSLNGYVTRRGAELGVATPVNKTLHALVKLREAAGRANVGGSTFVAVARTAPVTQVSLLLAPHRQFAFCWRTVRLFTRAASG
jgi:2-dehydropantoate 2-reductase